MKHGLALFAAGLAMLAVGMPSASAQPAEGVPKTLLPLPVLMHIINEASGDLALQNEILISGVNRNRLPQEYANGFFEPLFLIEKLKAYGVPDCRIIDLPSEEKTVWDAEMGELWMMKPDVRKIADLKEIAASLCSGSATLDVTAPLVYVGPGDKDRYYEGKDVAGKIVLVNGWPGGARRLAVDARGAVGIVAYSSSHPEHDPDQVGWSGLDWGEGTKPTIGFMVSTRQGNALRDALERGEAIELRAVAKTSKVPFKEQMVEAVIPGREFPNEELVFTAHLYEGFAKQGANDNISGCVSLLETARALRRLMDEGKIPPLKRTVRFLFVPEISGTIAYLKMHPEVGRRFFANINEDMVGEGLLQHRSVMELIQTPWSLPTYLNDAVRSFYEWMGTTQRDEDGEAYLPVRSPTGSRDPFYYVIDPYSGGSDHDVFVDGGVRVPSAFMIVWPDMWYHSSGDTPDKSDPTQLKRAVVLGAASAVLLAGAGPVEIEALIGEVGARSLERLGRELERAQRQVRECSSAGLYAAYKEADNILTQAFLREEEALNSIRFFIRDESRLAGFLAAQTAVPAALHRPYGKVLETVYANRCAKERIAPQKIALTAEEIRLGKLVPERTEKMRGPFDIHPFLAARRELKGQYRYDLGPAEAEVRNYIDGKRSILQIRNAAASQYGPLGLKDVETFVRILEKAGMVKIRSR